MSEERVFKVLEEETGLSREQIEQIFYHAGVDLAEILVKLSSELPLEVND